MFKGKNFKIEFKHLLTVVSAVGMVAGFIVALCSKKKAAACAAFFASFAGLIAGLGMESGLVPEPECCKKLEIEFGEDEDEDDWVNPFDDDEFDDGAKEEEAPEEDAGKTPEEGKEDV